MITDGVLRPTVISALYFVLLAGSADARGKCPFSCPRPGEPEYYTVCCTSTKNGYTEAYCCSAYMLAGILGGVFGALILIGVIIAIVCCWLVKSGRYKCVKYQTTYSTRYRLQKCTPGGENQRQNFEQNSQNNPVPLQNAYNNPSSFQTQYGQQGSFGSAASYPDAPPTYETAVNDPYSQVKREEKWQRF